eukprot:COSAG02_NODE_5131_length_4604_cov_6.767592_3_plen_146_part_00
MYRHCHCHCQGMTSWEAILGSWATKHCLRSGVRLGLPPIFRLFPDARPDVHEETPRTAERRPSCPMQERCVDCDAKLRTRKIAIQEFIQTFRARVRRACPARVLRIALATIVAAVTCSAAHKHHVCSTLGSAYQHLRVVTDVLEL